MKNTRMLVVYYSLYGHVHKMAQAVSEGATAVNGVEVVVRRVPETLPDDVITKMGAVDAQQTMVNVPIATVDDLAEADAIVFGTPTRFGNMCGQMRQFLDATGSLWQKGALVGKVGSVFASTGTQHGGQETTLLSFMVTLFHQGMIVVGLPYAYEGLLNMDEITGGTPYGATTMAGADGSRQPTDNELGAARFQGEHVARIAAQLKQGAIT
jgi:NAD(P)H dehydrogenase (quinone)